MFDSPAVSEIESPTWDAVGSASRLDWKRVDRELRAIAKKRAALDAEEARWLREAERLRIWRPLGMVSALDYMERVLGYTPHTARERLRVAKALAAVPAIGESFADGELSYSAIRELTRVAVADTDAEWRDFAVGKTVHEIEDAVATHASGSRPSDPPDPMLRPRVVRFELRPETYAKLRQVRTMLSDERDQHLDDNELIAALCDIALDRETDSRGAQGRARYQISMTLCERCKQGWQHGGGAKIPVDAAAVEQALCDAQHIGSIDGDAPERAHQDLPPALRRFIWHRDGGRCQTPGCRSTRGLEIHHLTPIAEGGQHVAWNCSIRCGACHHAHHDGRLIISGTAPDKIETRWVLEPAPRKRDSPSKSDDASTRMHVPAACRPHVVSGVEPADASEIDKALGRTATPRPRSELDNERVRVDAPKRSSKLDDVIVREEARTALVGMGWKPAIARRAIEAAASRVGREAPLDAWVREALRHCPLPRS